MPFDPSRTISQGSDVPVAVADSRSASEQLQMLRGEAIERSKRFNDGEYSFGYPKSHYESLAGEESSAWDFGTLKTICSLIELPGPWFRTKGDQIFYWMWRDGKYNSRTGVWSADHKDVRVSIAALKEAVNARIAALGLDPVALYRWSTEGHDEAESRKVRHMSLAEKIERFRRAQ